MEKASPTIATTQDLELFSEARAAFQKYLITRRELRWRADRFFKPSDAYTKAVARLLAAGVGTFQTCADECAALRAAAAGSDAFKEIPGTLSWMDVFFGRVCEVESRVPTWKDIVPLPTPPKRRRKRGEPPVVERVSVLDCTLLRDLGAHARNFMAAVRRLPHFQDTWNRREEVTVIAGLLRIRRGPLDDAEREFRQHFEKTAELLGKRALCTHDACSVAMCIRRLLPRDVSRQVLQFTGACSADFVEGPRLGLNL